MEKAEVQQRIVVVDEFPLPDIVAILTTEDYLVCNDTVYENTSFWNPQTLSNNYYLHHWGIYSVSPFVPAICYTTDNGTVTNIVTQTISGVKIEPVTSYQWDSENRIISVVPEEYENYKIQVKCVLQGSQQSSIGDVPFSIKLSPTPKIISSFSSSFVITNNFLL